MPIPYRPLAFGNKFIERAQGSGIEHMKVQKLTYLSYGWWLAFKDNPIINENPQVWKLGPVFRSMYFALQNNGSRKIYTVHKDFPFEPAPSIDDSDSETLDLIEWIWEMYGDRGSYDLSDLTHQKDTPWYQVASTHSFLVPKNLPIPDEIIKAHYRKLAIERGLSPS